MLKLSTKDLLFFTLKTTFVIAVFYWLYQAGHIDFQIIFKLFRSVEIVGVIVLLSIMFLLSFSRLFFLLNARAVDLKTTIRFKQVFRASSIGLFFNFTLPGGVGGDVVKLFYLTQNAKVKKTQVLKIIFYDRLIGLMALVFLFLMAYVFLQKQLPDNQFIKPIVLTSMLAFSGLAAFLFFNYRKRILVLFQAILISIASHILTVLIFYQNAQVFGYTDVRFLECLLLVPLGMVMTAIPITPAGIGVGQVAFFYIFRFYYGESSELGPTLMTAFHLLQFMFSFIGLYFYFTARRQFGQPVSV